MRDLLESLARKLVDEPDRVSVDQFEEDDGTIVLELTRLERDGWVAREAGSWHRLAQAPVAGDGTARAGGGGA